MAQISVCFTLNQMMDQHTVKHIRQELCRLTGVRAVAVGDGRDTVSVDFDSTGTTEQRIEKALCGMGLEVSAQKQTF